MSCRLSNVYVVSLKKSLDTSLMLSVFMVMEEHLEMERN